MNAGAQKVIDDAANRQVPADLLKKLDDADDRLHKSGAELEAAQSGSDYSHAETLQSATDGVRAAEKDVERAEDEIRGKLSGKSEGEPK
jgi:hypothetical protein